MGTVEEEGNSSRSELVKKRELAVLLGDRNPLVVAEVVINKLIVALCPDGSLEIAVGKLEVVKLG